MEQFHAVDNLGQRLVRVRGHDDDLDVAINFPYLTGRFNPIDPRRHSDVDIGKGNGTVRFFFRPDDFTGFLAPLVACRSSNAGKKGWSSSTINAPTNASVSAPTELWLQHLYKVVVDLWLIIHDQDAVVVGDFRVSSIALSMG